VSDTIPLADSTARRLLADAARVQRNGRLPSLVAGVVRDGSLAWSSGRGQVDGAEPDSDVQYRIGSITKTVTTVAVLRLRDEGLLRLDDPLERHVPGTPFGNRTIGQLLAHNAGLRAESPGLWWERVPGLTWPDLAAQFTAESEVPHGAGRRFHYSNLGFGTLGEVVARLRGRPWADVVREEVLLPLGMNRTTPRPEGRAAKGWAVHPWADVLLPEPEHDGGAMAAAGQLWATLTDLGRFAAFLLGDTSDVLAPASLEEMREPAGVDASNGDWSAYGLGLQVIRHDGVTLYGHGGSMPGFLAGVMVDPQQHTGALALANATTGMDGELVDRILATVREHEPYIENAWQPMASADPEGLSLIGTWYWGTSAYGLRLRSDGELELLSLLNRGRPSRFRRRADGGWFGLTGYHAGEPLRPVLDSSGQVIALDLGSFIFARTPYDPAAPVPGGVDPAGWQLGSNAG
jgi:CubicO group peptidase (beta-lactamase class C family)